MPCRSFVPDYAARLLESPGGGPPFAEHRQGVVLFADIVGFTPLAAALANGSRHGAEELSTLLNRFFARMVELVTGHGGTVASFAGDAITALFPLAGPEPARAAATRRAVGCALRMQAASQEFRDVPTAAGTFTLAMRAGLGAGEVLLAVVGDPAIRLDHVLAGAALDRAVAAEQGAAQGQVRLDPDLRLDPPPAAADPAPRVLAGGARCPTNGWPRSSTRRSPSGSTRARSGWSTSAARSRSPSWTSPARPDRPSWSGCSGSWPRPCEPSTAGAATCSRSTWATRGACWWSPSAPRSATRTRRNGRCGAARSCLPCPMGPSGPGSPPAGPGAARSARPPAASTPWSATPSTWPPG